MILVVANIYLKDGGQNEFLEKAKDCINGTLKESGNISYDLTKSIDDNCKFTFVEKWKSNEDLKLHMETQHFKNFGASIKNLLSKDLEINVFDASQIN